MKENYKNRDFILIFCLDFFSLKLLIEYFIYVCYFRFNHTFCA